MNYWINLAFKNILRKKQRTMLTMLPVVFGTAMLIFVLSMLEGVNNDSKANLRNYDSADLKIVSRDFSLDKKGFGVQEAFYVPEDLENFLNSSKFVKAHAKEVIFSGNLSDGTNKMAVICRGVDFEAYSKTFLTLAKVYPPVLELDKGVILIGEDIFKWYEMPYDSVFILQSRTGGGTFDAIDLSYDGLVATGNPKIDRTTVYMNIKDADEFLNLNSRISAIAVKLKNPSDLNRFINEIKPIIKKYPELKLISWEELAVDIIAIDSAKKYSSSVMIFIILIIGGVGIANTILLSVYERMKEIGTMRAMGASNSTIVKMFVFEGASVGFVAAAMGMILGTVLMAYISFVGIDIGGMVQDIDIGYPIKSVFRGQFDLLLAFRAGFFGLIIGIAASFYPAYRVVKENIVRTLR
ncbi:MAG: FtsX-like permease family protein [bacterium]|nr:FtsX-like permease family protein [bacterium]